MYSGTLVPVYYGNLRTNSNFLGYKGPVSWLLNSTTKFNDSSKTWVDLKVYNQLAKAYPPIIFYVRRFDV